MDYKIGIEMRDEYKFFELAKGAMKLVRDVMLVKPGEDVVITWDSTTDRRVVDATARAIYLCDATPTVVYFPTCKEFYGEPYRPVGGAVANCDVWIEFAYASNMHSDAYRTAVDKNSARYICLTGMDTEMMVNTIAKVNYDKVVEFGEYLTERLSKVEDIIIRSKNGTDLKANQKGRKIRHSGQKATKKGYPVMLCGQVSWCPIEETIEGTLVFDGALYPPEELGILRNNVILTIKEGRIVDFAGEGEDYMIFKNWIESFNDPNMYRLAHYSMGFNPGVMRLTGRIVEDERVFGCIEFGIGSQGVNIGGAFWNAAAHTDGTLLKPTIILDGQVFEQDGVYVDEKAREFCRELGVAGY